MSSPKSAYNIPTKKGKLDTHIFVVWVDNESGVLARVVGLFSGRGYNIAVSYTHLTLPTRLPV